MSAKERAAGLVAGALGLSACSPAFQPVPAPTAWRAGTGVRVDAMKVGPQGPGEREKDGGMRLLLTMHAPCRCPSRAAFEQLWIPTLHAERPTTVLGLGLVNRIAM